MYKVVKVLKNGCRVSPLLPKSSGMRKTYQANGKTISVDEGWDIEFSARMEAMRKEE